MANEPRRLIEPNQHREFSPKVPEIKEKTGKVKPE
jgi:hypothetical protein